MAILLVLLFLVLPIVELYVIIQVGDWLGVGPTIVLLLAISVLGAWLVKREGAHAWRAFRLALGERRLPHREVADGGLIMLGGALLLTPGFVTDVLGLLLLFPPTRAGARRMLMGMLTMRLGVGKAMVVRTVARGARRRERVIDGTVATPTGPAHPADPDRR